ncbi:MAG: hypothetical protein QOD69_1217 [Solirubrobacteraceae bacterium]|nr:hypothetical protein [Solirubrobacteraceae bacterium]
MTPILGVSTTVTVLAIIGLVVGLVVLLVVIWLLQSTLAPLRAVLTDVNSAHDAPMLERGVPGTEQLGQTRRLAESVPPLALAYLGKLNGGARPAPPPAAPAFPTPSEPAAPAAEQPASEANLPGWQRFQARQR